MPPSLPAKSSSSSLLPIRPPSPLKSPTKALKPDVSGPAAISVLVSVSESCRRRRPVRPVGRPLRLPGAAQAGVRLGVGGHAGVPGTLPLLLLPAGGPRADPGVFLYTRLDAVSNADWSGKGLDFAEGVAAAEDEEVAAETVATDELELGLRTSTAEDDFTSGVLAADSDPL